ncbi:hypothetical protein GA0070624_3458 [Micromonospora rhizosphaerae]|uniref:Uncharacterized protein n=1 Tax=Micromonospora rhizosphaerae TaxID=568872 RepID=A0A1C6SCT5_9ACTN|nr:hypothetical protein [Micromonospora rhizosphaerae]SCL27216.1 hypothetical protein GA0070624_3458 [Micromonospora rhizosphaerae]
MVMDLSAVARERAVLATIADAMVTASVGRGLRVEVACPDTHLAVVDHLAQALHVRGRPCRSLASKPNPSSTVSLPSRPEENRSTVLVVSSGPSGTTDDDVERLDINVTVGAPRDHRGGLSHQRPDEGHTDADHEPDIILAYHESDGPMIRHMASHLSSPPLAPQ